MYNHSRLKIENAVIDEDVIVVNPSSPMHGKIGQVWKNGICVELQKVSVLFEGEIYNFGLQELTLA